MELGKTLTLNVTYQTYSKVVVTWSKNGKSLISSDLGSTDPRASIKGQGTLVLINTTLSDNGTYKQQARTIISTKDIEMVVVIQGKYSKYMSYIYRLGGPYWKTISPRSQKRLKDANRGEIFICADRQKTVNESYCVIG